VHESGHGQLVEKAGASVGKVSVFGTRGSGGGTGGKCLKGALIADCDKNGSENVLRRMC
jgi:hypothetical protein